MTSRVTELRPLSAIQEAAADWYTRRIGNELTPGDERLLEQWLAADARHVREYEAMESLWAGAGAVADKPAIAELRASASREGPPNIAARASSPARRSWYAIAASMALVAVVTGMFAFNKFAEPARFTTALGEQQSLTLDDGTLVELDADSRLSLAYTPGERRVILEFGQAHFSVFKDPSRPFVVEAGDSEVRALGTAFQVYRRSDSVTVTLLEGRVEVSSIGASPEIAGSAATDTTWRQRLEPGEQVTVKTAQAVMPAVSEVSIDRATSWRRGTLDFDALPLPDVVVELNRYSKTPIRIVDPALNEVRVSGIFQIGDTETMLLALETGFDIDARRPAPGGDIGLYAATRP